MRTEMNKQQKFMNRYGLAIDASLCIVVALIAAFFISKPYIKTLKEANIETTAVISELGGKVTRSGCQKHYHHTQYTFTDNLGNKCVVYGNDENTWIGILFYKHKKGQEVKLWYNAETGAWRTRCTDSSYGFLLTCIGIFIMLGIIALIKGIEAAKTKTW